MFFLLFFGYHDSKQTYLSSIEPTLEAAMAELKSFQTSAGKDSYRLYYILKVDGFGRRAKHTIVHHERHRRKRMVNPACHLRLVKQLSEKKG